MSVYPLAGRYNASSGPAREDVSGSDAPMPRVKVTLISGRCRKCPARAKARVLEFTSGIRIEVLGFSCACGGPDLGPMIDVYDWNWSALDEVPLARRAVSV